VLVEHLQTKTTASWLVALQEAGLWAMEVLNWDEMTDHPAYNALQMEQTIHVADKTIVTTRCPIRINGQRLAVDKPAPQLGEQNEKIRKELAEVTS
jgi:crotonobetainyl-CoA:carnitine CoA-transferase CaiB-like acyl-CoA transferase